VLNRHRRRLGLTVAWLCLLGTASAFAYWTTAGTGSGTATTGTASAVTITQTSAVSGMYPGNGDQDIEFKITNGSSGAQYVSTVTASISSITKAGAPAAGCTAADFALTQAPTAINGDLSVGDTAFTGTKTPKIKMVNGSGNQDACKGVTVNLSFSAA
jgi:hypothetical protein